MRIPSLGSGHAVIVHTATAKGSLGALLDGVVVKFGNLCAKPLGCILRLILSGNDQRYAVAANASDCPAARLCPGSPFGGPACCAFPQRLLPRLSFLEVPLSFLQAPRGSSEVAPSIGMPLGCGILEELAGSASAGRILFGSHHQ